MTIVISGRTIGSKRPLFADWSIPLNPDDFGGGGGMTLRELIIKIVHTEVAAYEERQESRRLDRVMTRSQIESARTQGKISPEGRRNLPAAPLDEAIDTALAAFQDGLYLVIIDGAEVRALDAAVYLKPDSRVTFLRLTFLAGA